MMIRKDGRKLSEADVKRYGKLREKIQKEFPPKARQATKPDPGSIAERLRTARMAQGLTWYAVAKAAGIPNSGTIRDMEAGADAKLSNVQAVAAVLGLRLELHTVEGQP